MAIYGESLTIQYIAWDTVNNAPKTGDASNHTLRWVKDGVAAAPTNSPSEVDATNAPGVYKVTLTATETQCWVGTLCGKSSTSGVVLMPITLTFERLPTAAPGASGGIPVIGSAPLTVLEVPTGTVQSDAGNTAKLFKTNLTGADSLYVGMFLVFTSGGNQHITREVIAFTGSTGFIEVNRPFPNTPTAGDTFRVLGYSGR